MKQKILVVFQDGCPDLERTAVAVAERLESDGREIVVKPAGKVSIPEILAAGLYIFGAQDTEPASYSELARVFAGINLVGRKLACFGSNGAAVAWIKALVGDSELAQVGSDFVAVKPEPAAIAAWVRSFS